MKNDAAIQKTLKHLMAVQRVAVLATHGDGQPHGSLVAFVVSDDLRDVVFATSRTTRKFANLSKDARVALVIDNRTNQEADFQQAIAVTVSGKASEVKNWPLTVTIVDIAWGAFVCSMTALCMGLASRAMSRFL